MTSTTRLALIALSVFVTTSLVAENRFEKAIQKFEAEDRESPPPKGAVLFLGSSSIRMWPLEESFPGLPKIHRGFGGSEISDSIEFAERIVLNYEPRAIVFYAGDNDVAKGKSAEVVHRDFENFVDLVHAKLPETRIVYVAIKPSLARWNLVKAMRDANRRIRKSCDADARLEFADIDGPMLGADGKPRGELFVKDGLHLSAAGYELWTSIVAPRIAPGARYLDYVGHWDLTILNSRSTFRAGAFSLALDDEGAPRGEVLWRWASVHPLDAAKLRLTKEGLELRSGNIPGPLVLERRGRELEGRVEAKDGVFYVHGARNRLSADPRGTWDIVLEKNGEDYEGRLEISGAPGHYRATGVKADGEAVTISDLRVENDTLHFLWSGEREFRAELEGDRLKGLVPDSDGGFRVTGTRRRSWGEPIDLLAASAEAGRLRGWTPRETQKPSSWAVRRGEDGWELVNERPAVNLVSDAEFQDFRLHLEYAISPGGNSGIYLRGRYEVQVLDDSNLRPARPGQKDGKVRPHGNGAVYSRIAPSANVSKQPGEWQTVDIELVGRWITVTLNSTKVIDHRRLQGITGGALSSREELPGPLMLQGDHGRVRFRNIRVTPALP